MRGLPATSSLIRACALFAGFFALPGNQLAYAEDRNVLIEARYEARLLNMTLGVVFFAGKIEGNEFAFSAKAGTHGLTRVLIDIDGEAVSIGTLEGTTLRPETHRYAYTAPKKNYFAYMAFDGTDIAKLEVDPIPKKKKARIPVLDKHRKGVIDAFSAIVYPLSREVELLSPAACDREIPIFDGRERYNVKLEYKGLDRVDTGNGYRGPVLVCRARYIPIAGHRNDDEWTAQLSTTKEIEVRAAPVPEAHALILQEIRAPTPLGIAAVTAKTLKVSQP